MESGGRRKFKVNKMTDLTKDEIISQLQARIKELENTALINAQSSFNVVKYFANKSQQ